MIHVQYWKEQKHSFTGVWIFGQWVIINNTTGAIVVARTGRWCRIR